MTRMFEIEPVCGKNLNEVLSLRLAAGQEGFVEPVEDCLREAGQVRFFVPAALRLHGTVAGFAMYGAFPNEREGRRVWLDRLLLDRSYQGKGLGRQMVLDLLRHLHKEYRCPRIYLSIFANNVAALRLYESLGFRFNGELDRGGERIMVLEGKATGE